VHLLRTHLQVPKTLASQAQIIGEVAGEPVGDIILMLGDHIWCHSCGKDKKQ